MMNVKVLHSNTPKPLMTATPIMAEMTFQLRRWRREGALARHTRTFGKIYIIIEMLLFSAI